MWFIFSKAYSTQKTLVPSFKTRQNSLFSKSEEASQGESDESGTDSNSEEDSQSTSENVSKDASESVSEEISEDSSDVNVDVQGGGEKYSHIKWFKAENGRRYDD